MEPVAFAALVTLDPTSPQTLTAQIHRGARDAIRSGHLRAGETLPSSRAAASALAVARNTVNVAYDLLRAEGLIEAKQGAAPRIRPVTRCAPVCAPLRVNAALAQRGQALALDPRAGLHAASDGWLQPGTPDEALFPRALFSRALRQVTLTRYASAAAYRDYSGLRALREGLATRLAADRGVDAAPERILIVPGAQAGLSLIAQTLCDANERALVESPGYAGAHAAFRGAGLEVSPLPVDGAGADISRTRANARLAYVTPSNQYPLGARMTLARRTALASWARTHGAWIVEDDYDGEFHWRGAAIGALQAFAPDVTIYVGAVSKSLMPSLRLGWIVVPSPLADPLRRAHRALGLAANLHVQAALAHLIETGAWRTHLRKIARVYAARGNLLADMLQTQFAGRLLVHRPDGGVQLAARLLPGYDEAIVMAKLGAAGFAVGALSRYGYGIPCPSGLVIGFADADTVRVARFAAALDDALSHAAVPD